MTDMWLVTSLVELNSIESGVREEERGEHAATCSNSTSSVPGGWCCTLNTLKSYFSILIFVIE